VKRLGKYFFWLCCFVLACFMLTVHPAAQGIAIGLATIPVVDGVDDPHARVILSVLAFIGLSWLSLWVAEAVAILVAVEIGRALTKWYKQVSWADAELATQGV
jgi:hypothetical protein